MKIRSLMCITTFASVLVSSQALAGGIIVGPSDDLCVIFDNVRGVDINANVVIGDSWDTATRTSGGEVRPAGILTMDYIQASGSIQAFCAELDQALSTEAVCYLRTDVADLPSTAPMGELRAGIIANHYYHNYATVTSSDSSAINAAFQLVLWEISEEGWDGVDLTQLDLSIGAMQFTTNNTEVTNAAASMLSNLTNNPNERMSLDGWQDVDSQDLITVSVVPGPSIALAGALGLAGLRRRRRN